MQKRKSYDIIVDGTNSIWGISAAGSAFDWQSRGQGFEPPMLHQINIIRTFIQSEMGSDLLYISRKLQIGKRKNGRTAEYGNPPICFM